MLPRCLPQHRMFFMRSFLLPIVVSVLALSGMSQKRDSRVQMSEASGDRLVTHMVQPICPDPNCALCKDSEVVLQLVVAKGGNVKRVTVVRARDSRLAEAARIAVKQWRYDRYILNGTSVEYVTLTTIKSWMCGT